MEHRNFPREHQVFSITIDAPVEEIYPLGCPVEELKWLDGWSYTMIYSDSGRNENNCIFSETMSAPVVMGNGKPGTTYWVTTLYDPVRYAKHWLLVRDSTVTKTEVTMKPLGSRRTEVTWDMTITATREEAAASFDKGMKDRMTMMMAYIGKSLKHYCETGTKLVFKGGE